ncbi:MAG TPA: ABC transporter ATP-binding protein [Nannocystaceae bacterium]|nr:ABC transporter ATP-binding protein [Nannocystaceae bacterium]
MTGPCIAPLELTGIDKRFGRLSVLRGIDLAVAPGEIVGLLGANGCGKTTLLSIAAGLLAPTGGQRSYGPDGVADLESIHRARLAFVAHSTQLYARLDARENLRLAAELFESGSTAAQIDALLERLGIAHAADRLVGTYSRGMQQRLAIARALLARPDLLLLDEPFTALDRGGRELLTRVLSAERDRGAAILLTSHDLDAIAEVTDRVVLLADGRIVGEARREPVAADDASPVAYAERIRRLGTRDAHA